MEIIRPTSPIRGTNPYTKQYDRERAKGQATAAYKSKKQKNGEEKDKKTFGQILREKQEELEHDDRWYSKNWIYSTLMI